MRLLRAMTISIAAMIAVGIWQPAAAGSSAVLESGDAVPAGGDLVDSRGKTIEAKSLWAKGPAVVVFYLGHW